MTKCKEYTSDSIEDQTELKNQYGNLLNDKGQLMFKGWARQPLIKYNPEALGRWKKAYRLKEWNYYSVGSDRFYFAVAAIDLGYVINFQVFFIDFVDNKTVQDEVTSSSLTKGLLLPRDSCQQGIHLDYKSKSYSQHFEVNERCPANNESKGVLEVYEETLVHTVKVTSQKLKLVAELTFNLSPKRESVVLCTPIGKSNFYYNRKTNLIPVTGSLMIDGKEYLGQYQLQDAFGILDWGRGIWDYNSFWIWSTCWGHTNDGRPIGLNLGTGFGDLTTHTENAINMDGIIHKLGHIEFEYNKKDLMAPWRFICRHGRFGSTSSLSFTPFRKKWENNNFGLVMSSFHQIIGKLTGELILDSGEKVDINIHSFTEVHFARW
ncbi:hypothetical protein SAMD00019534_123250 [Acytostelium subglobosum LB1]|uniref:hypothetical protein n=1 Tax=Acytostelium subglobosum LB1 TaxID=1410327 RepID=UPI000644A141|nr:hypothetical protein SAMD00019534_123250 [Acytostelium subglobosum LB1]GAM29149.1 hypothetical protein SAMD00019534_123250 [Acytostelium subglobosum LB1]|eukprot:XP_012747840.1 hypothetical protein SAMD00019534_123250 [Acytostelium subglobosum LB1]